MDLSIVAYVVEPEFWTISLFLFCLGIILKHRTALKNNLISITLFGVSAIISTTWGALLPSAISGVKRCVEIIVMYGIVRGLSAAALASWVWDSGHGLSSLMKSKKDE